MADTTQAGAREREFPLVWVISNRVDDRVALFEKHPAHPNGDAFVAGSAPSLVAKTPDVEHLIFTNVLAEVPEPVDGPKKPKYDLGDEDITAKVDQPGQPVRLGRQLDPDLFPPEAVEAKAKATARGPKEIPVPAGVVAPKDKDAK